MSQTARFSRKIMFASVIGGTVEFYDFTLYGTLAFAFAPLFFPSHDQFVSMLGAYAVFAVGFFARPLGAAIFGHIGDSIGRRTALFWSLMLMSFATLLMGILPTYQSIGLLAPVLMVFARLLQGLSAGGEYSGALIFGIEHGSLQHSGLIGSTISAGCMAGLVFGNFASFICSLPQLPAWSWRVPFLIGFLVSAVGIYVRFRLEEPPLFVAQKQANVKQGSFLKEVKGNVHHFFSAILLAGFNGIALYVYFVFLPSFIVQEMVLSQSTVKLYSCISTLILMFLLVVFGGISDKLNRLYLILAGAVLTTITASCLFYSISYLSGPTTIIYQLMFVVAFAMFSGPLNTFIVEIFPVGVRYRCASLSYSLGMGLIGGSAPLVAGMLSMNTYKTWLLSGYFWIGGILALFALWRIAGRENPYKIPYII